jgi:hypothetical protein
MLNVRVLFLATLLLVATCDFHFNFTAEFSACIVLETGSTRNICLDELHKKAALVFTYASEQRAVAGEQRAVAGEQRAAAGEERAVAGEERAVAGEERSVAAELRSIAAEGRSIAAEERAIADHKNILAIPGMAVDTANPLSIAVALVFVVSVMAGGVLQCCGPRSPKPYIILLIFLGFSLGLGMVVWLIFPSHLGACTFTMFFSLMACGAMSAHFLRDDRPYLSQVWAPFKAAGPAAATGPAAAQAAAPAAQAAAATHNLRSRRPGNLAAASP